MKVTNNLRGNKTDFFQLLENSIISDYYQNTNIKINEVKEGLQYKKTLSTKMKSTGNVNVLIKQFDKDSIYEVHYITETTSNVVTYTVETVNENEITVTYEENNIDNNTLLKINNSIMSMFFMRSSKKRVAQMFKNIQVALDNEVKVNG